MSLDQNNLDETGRLISSSVTDAQNTFQTIEQQGSVLQDISDDVTDTQNLLYESRTIVRRMLCRALFNRLFIYFIILGLVAGNIIGLYLKFHNK